MGTRWVPFVVGGLLVVAVLAFFLLGERPEGEREGSGPDPDDTGPVDPVDPVLRGVDGAGRADADRPARLPAPTPPVEEAGGAVLVGRVVDDHRRSVEGARVVTRGLPVEHVAATDADGRFRLAVGRTDSPAPSVLLLAFDAAGRTGRRSAGSYADAVGAHDVGSVVLVASTELVVAVRSPEDQPVAGARVGLFHDLNVLPVLLQEVRTDAEGGATFSGLVPGSWRVVAWASGVGRGHAHVTLDAVASTSVVVPLSAACPFEVHVVDRDTEAGIPGARVTIREYAPTPHGYRTFAAFWPPPSIAPADEEGVARVSGLSANDRLYVYAEADGYPPGEPKHRQAYGHSASQGTYRLVLTKTRTVRWPIKDGDEPPPPDGTTLVLHPDPSSMQPYLPPTGRVEAGHIVAEGAERTHLHGVAEAPDGRLARLYCLQDDAVGHATTFVEPRTIDVVVTKADGDPATGLFVLAMGPGNNVLGGPLALDAEGKARLGPFDRSRMNVFLSDSQRRHGGRSIGVIDVTEGSGTIEHVLAEPVRVRLEVTVDGERRLPPEYVLWLGGLGVADVREEPEAAVLEGWLHPDAGRRSRSVHLSSPGYLPFDGEVPEGVKEAVLEADLRRGSWLDVRVRRPEDGRYALNLQRREGDDWQPIHQRVSTRGRDRPPPAETLHRLGPLAAGRYRVLDEQTGASTEEVDVPVGPGRVDLPFDLSRAGEVRGRVEVPAGASPSDARLYLLAPGEEVSARIRDRRVRRDGTFRVRVSGTRELRLVVRHATLIADPESRGLMVGGPTEGIVLRLVQGPTAVFRLTNREAVRTAGGTAARASPGVRLYRKGFVGEALGTFQAVADGDTWRFGGFDPGTYAVLIDCEAWVPAALPEVVLTDGETDLGAPLLVRGSALRIRVQAPEGQDPPRIFARVTRRGTPSYFRFVHSFGEAEVVVPGLGAGTFDVTLSLEFFSSQTGNAKQVEIEVDGRNDVTIDYDPRI